MKKERGITLISLVVVIIVLIILAGVLITMMSGDNSIINLTLSAKEEHNITSIKERLNLELSGIIQEQVINNQQISKAKSLEKFEDLNYEVEKEEIGSYVWGYIIEEGYYFEIIEKEDGTQEVIYIGKKNEVHITKHITIKYVANGGEGTMKDEILVENIETELQPNIFTKSGYYFNGWKDQSGNSYDDKATIIAKKNLVLTAQWIEKVTITYASNGGTGTMANSMFIKNVNSTLSENEFTKSGYAFTGWKDQNGNSYTDKATITPIEDLTLTAQWSLVTYCATIHLTGEVCFGSGGAENYNSTESGSISSLNIKINYTKNGVVSIQDKSYIGPTFRDWWSRNTAYNIGWRLYNASVTKDNNVMDTDIQIPVAITGALEYGANGSTSINRTQSTDTWNTVINVSKNNTISLSSTDSGARGTRDWWDGAPNENGVCYYSMRWHITNVTSSFTGW